MSIARDFAREMDKQAREIEQAMGAGKVASWEDYKRQCGIIQGLARAKDALNSIARKYLDDDEVSDE